MEKETHIQSISDIITNSSSEIFIIHSDYSLKELEKMFAKHYSEHYWENVFDTDEKKEEYNNLSKEEQHKVDMQCNYMSGMAMTYEFNSPENIEHLSDGERDLLKDEHFQLVELDWNAHATIEWLKQTFGVMHCLY